jgi:hypothetical protein
MHVRRFELSADGLRPSNVSTLDRLGLDGVGIAVVYDPDHRGEQVSGGMA